MPSPPFHVELDPAAAIDIPPAGTLSRTLHADDDLRVVVFGFAQGEELTEHTSSRPAVIQANGMASASPSTTGDIHSAR